MSASHTTWSPRATLLQWSAIVRWAARRYVVVLVSCVVALAALFPLLAANTPMYQAEAFVIAQQLGIEPAALPAYGQAVFSSAAMAKQLASQPDLPDDADRLLAGSLDVVADKGSILLTVLARADQPAAAARLADLAAAAYVAELNSGGSGVGSFVVQGQAQVPTTPMTESPSVLLGSVVGAAAGIALALALLVLLTVVRQPVVREPDVEATVGRPVIGTVVLPRQRKASVPDPHTVSGLVPTARVFLPLTDGSVVLLSTAEDVPIRQRLLLLLTVALSPYRTIFVSADPQLEATVTQQLATAYADGLPLTGGPGLELIDGILPADVLEVPDWRLPVILVISQGLARGRLRRLGAENVDEEILGVVMVEERRSLPRRLTRRQAGAPTSNADEAVSERSRLSAPSPGTPTSPSAA